MPSVVSYSMNKHYHGYTLKKSDAGYTLVTPAGVTLCGVAVNFRTACKWVEQHQAETRALRHSFAAKAQAHLTKTLLAHAS